MAVDGVRIIDNSKHPILLPALLVWELPVIVHIPCRAKRIASMCRLICLVYGRNIAPTLTPVNKVKHPCDLPDFPA